MKKEWVGVPEIPPRYGVKNLNRRALPKNALLLRSIS